MSDELWNVISEGSLTTDETTTLTQLLRVLLKQQGSVGTAIAFSDEQRTATKEVYNISIIEPTERERGCIIASLYEHPARMVVAVLNQPGGPTTPGSAPIEAHAREEDDFDRLIANYSETA
jgi:hypothetical protein